MLHDIAAWQRLSLDAWSRWLDLAGLAPDWHRLASAGAELASRAFDSMEGDDLTLEAAVARDLKGPVGTDRLCSEPFWDLVRFDSGREGPDVLLVAPCSGYAASILSELVATLLSTEGGAGRLAVMAWRSARDVPLSAGRFDLVAQGEAIGRAMACMDRPFHLLALSQSGPAALAALSTRRPGGAAQPLSAIFLGCPLGEAQGMTAVQGILEIVPRELFETAFIVTVPPPFAGEGRRVYPGQLQLLAYGIANPANYMAIQSGAWFELATGQPGDYGRQFDDLHRLADVPAELYLDTLDLMLGQALPVSADGAKGAAAIDPAGLEDLPLLTIEAGADELIGPGQTHAVHHLEGRFRHDGDQALTVERAEHHGLFIGTLFQSTVAPAIARFIAGESAKS